MQQLRATFPEADPYRYVIFDHDSKFNVDVIDLLISTGFSAEAHKHSSGKCCKFVMRHLVG